MSNNIQHQLLHYENEPPPEVWERIASSLNEKHHIPFQDRLYHFEDKPPSEVWPSIQQQLDTTKPAITFKQTLHWKKPIAIAASLMVLTSLILFALYKNNMLPQLLTRKEKPSLQQASTSADVHGLKALSTNHSNTAGKYILWTNDQHMVVTISKKIYPLFTK